MIRIKIPNSCHNRRLPFYLALEEWAAQALPPAEYFFTWIVVPTVICGRNQDVVAEVDLEYCHRNNIDVYRRKSGGGCVYADHNNIMVSCITPCTDVEAAFSKFSAKLAKSLQSLGLNAQATGRNDVLIDNRKVSGGAFYKMPTRSIIHSTMLFSTDMGHMLKAITPARAKLESKRVTSVKSRITTVSEHLPALEMPDFHAHIISELTSGEISISPDQIMEIEAIEKNYYYSDWIMGKKKSKFAGNLFEANWAIEGAGQVKVHLGVDPESQTITGLRLSGDFFPLSNVDSALLKPLVGVPMERTHLEKAFTGIKVSEAIAGLNNNDFLEILLNSYSKSYFLNLNNNLS